jgi:hypothetical protein
MGRKLQVSKRRNGQDDCGGSLMTSRRKKYKRVSGCGRDPRKGNVHGDKMIFSSREDEFEAFAKLPRALRDWLNTAPSKFSSLEIASIYRREKNVRRTLIVLGAHTAKRWPDFVPIQRQR